MNRLRTDPLSLDDLVREVRHAGAGAIATFEGTVRDVNEGRAVTLLEYEAYGPMAEIELAKILDEIRAEIPEARVAAVHRVGPLRVGEAAVLCAASAPHRGEAFRACRATIDRLKARLPIWKREHGPEGPYWVGWEDARCAGDDHDHGAHAHRDHAHGDHERGDHEHREHTHGDHAHREHTHGDHAHREHTHGDHARGDHEHRDARGDHEHRDARGDHEHRDARGDHEHRDARGDHEHRDHAPADHERGDRERARVDHERGDRERAHVKPQSTH